MKQRLQKSLLSQDQLPSRFIIDGEFVVVQESATSLNDPNAIHVKPFHDVSVLLGKKEKKLEKVMEREETV